MTFWSLGLVLLGAVIAVGVLAWSRTEPGKAILLSYGADKLHADVQDQIGTALGTVFGDYHSGPAGVDPPGDSRARNVAHDWPLHRVSPTATVRCRLVRMESNGTFWEAQAEVAAAVAAVGGRILWGERVVRDKGVKSAAGREEETELLRLDLGVTGRPTHTLLLYCAEAGPPDLRWGASEVATAWDLLADHEGDPGAPTVALVIDDWGNFQSDVTTTLLALPVPLTLSVLPGRPYSRRFALEATSLALPDPVAEPHVVDGRSQDPQRRRRSLGCPVELRLATDESRLLARRREIILHLPMEPQDYPRNDPGAAAVMAGMSQDEIDRLLDRALVALPTVRGVNNHMGSRATADTVTMGHLMSVLRNRGLFFLDSMTTSRSVAYETATQHDVAALRNRIFLDQSGGGDATVAANLEILVRAARTTGFAVGIGHPQVATARVLRAEIERLVAEGVRFVTLSELLELRAARTAERAES